LVKNFDEITHDIGENRNAEKQDEGGDQSLEVRSGVKVAEADG
jgi:hypothetical protein